MTTVRSVTVKLKADISDFNRGLLEAAAGARAFSKDLSSRLDSSNDRMSNLIQTSVALGPALIPVLAGGAVGAAGLAAALGTAVGGAGVAVLALNGVGDALDSLNKYKLEPTDANLDALRDKLKQLGPAGQDFVFFLESIKPKLDALNDTAEAGFLPGLQVGIEDALRQFPVVQRIVGELASTLGDLSAEGGAELNSPFWDRFFDTIARDASDAESTLLRTIGNITEGVAGIFLAFEPVGTDFSHELLDMSRDFDAWGQHLEDNPGFQHFVDYARENGPAVAEALGAITDAVIGIVEAGAPVGHELLPVITILAHVLGDIARSPAGPVLFGAAAGLAALARSVALLKTLNAPVLFGGIAKLGGSGVTEQTARLRGLAAGVGILALSLTDLDDQAGVSDILTGAAIGSVFGPWGAAIGGAVGSVKTLASANDDLEEAMRNVDGAFDSQTVSLQGQRDALSAAQSEWDAYEAKLTDFRTGIGPGRDHDASVSSLIAGIQRGLPSSLPFGIGAAGQEQADFDKLVAHAQDLGVMVDELGQFRQALQGLPQGGLEGATTDLDKLQATANTAFPILEKAGYSIETITRLLHTAPGRAVLANAIEAYNEAADSVPGRAQAVETAIAGLDSAELSAADAATALQAALDELLSPGMDLSAATDAWTTSLRELRGELSKESRTLVGNSNAAIQNRAAIRDRVDALETTLVASAKAGASSAALSGKLLRERQALLEAGAAAGMSRGELQDYLHTLGLTPALVKTIIKEYGADAAAARVRTLLGYINALHDKTVTITERHVFQQLTQQGGGAFGINQADGAVVDYYGRGGLRENHVAQIAPAGSWRVWGEPETGGEAYIPLAPSKRTRSRSIADETVSRLGGVVQWLADGGIGQRSAGWSSSQSGLVGALHGMATQIAQLERTLVERGIPITNTADIGAAADGIARTVVKEYQSKATRLGAGVV